MLYLLICLILVAAFWKLLRPWFIGLAGLVAIGGVILCIWLYVDAHDPKRLAAYAQSTAELAAEYKRQEDWRNSDHRTEWERNMGYK
jgi:peptidoglycan/LPS O-acetylase OafA/YrhL